MKRPDVQSTPCFLRAFGAVDYVCPKALAILKPRHMEHSCPSA